MSRDIRDALRARGHDARIFASTARPVDDANFADHTCFGSVGVLRRAVRFANPSAVLRLRRTLESFRPDIVHLRMYLTQLSPLVLPVLRSVPTLLHLVNYDQICPTNTKVLPDGSPCRHRMGMVCHRTGCRSLSAAVYSNALLRVSGRLRDGAADMVIANSDWVRTQLRAEGVPVDAFVWNGVARVPARPPLTGPPLVAYAGRLDAKKGVDVLIRAMAGVVGTHPGARLRIAGHGQERAGLERLVSDLGLTGRVEFLGYVPRAHLEQAFGDAWVQAVPSIWAEPFGLVAAEAMMRGTAVVVTDRGGLAEMVVEGETGFRVPANDDAALAEAITRVLADRALAERMGAAARAHALEHLTIDGAVERYLGLYADVIRRADAAAG